MWPFSLFKKKEDPNNYETILSNLAISISSKQTRLSEIRIRERRATLVATVYALGGWFLYMALWWTLLPRVTLWSVHSRDDRTLQAILKGIPVVGGPVFILFIRRIVQWWYTRIGNKEEKELKALMAEQRVKIEEIKKKTNYYSTKNLLERYDDSSMKPSVSPSTPIPPGGLRQRTSKPPLPNASPALSMQAQPNPLQNSTPAKRIPPLLQSLASPQPMTPPQKQWYDKLADALLGDDEASSGAMHSRYALICENCFAHNGLVRESEWDDMKYVCPKCGHFNPSPRMRREHPEDIPNSRASSRVTRPSPAPTPMSAAFSTPDRPRRSLSPVRPEQANDNSFASEEADSSMVIDS